MLLSDRVIAFLELERQTCHLLEPASVQALALAATRFYVGYGHNDLVNFLTAQALVPATTPIQKPDPLAEVIGGTDPEPVPRMVDPDGTAGPVPPVKPETLLDDAEVTESDWVLIRPLFLLYVEREQALMLEATRVMGADVWGRSSSEIQGDINLYESELGRKAFIQPVFSI